MTTWSAPGSWFGCGRQSVPGVGSKRPPVSRRPTSVDTPARRPTTRPARRPASRHQGLECHARSGSTRRPVRPAGPPTWGTPRAWPLTPPAVSPRCSMTTTCSFRIPRAVSWWISHPAKPGHPPLTDIFWCQSRGHLHPTRALFLAIIADHHQPTGLAWSDLAAPTARTPRADHRHPVRHRFIVRRRPAGDRHAGWVCPDS